MNTKSYLEGFFTDIETISQDKKYKGKYKGTSVFIKLYQDLEEREEAKERNEMFLEMTPGIIFVKSAGPIHLIAFRWCRPIVSLSMVGMSFAETLDGIINKIHKKGYGLGNLGLKHIVLDNTSRPLVASFARIYSLENHTWQTELIMREKRWEGRFYEYVLNDYRQWRKDVKELYGAEFLYTSKIIPTKPNEEYYQERYTRQEYIFGDKALKEKTSGTVYAVYEGNDIKHYVSKVDGKYRDSTGIYTNELTLFKVLELQKKDPDLIAPIYRLEALFSDEVKKTMTPELYNDQDQCITRIMEEYHHSSYKDKPETQIDLELAIFDIASLMRFTILEAGFSELFISDSDSVSLIVLQSELSKATYKDICEEFTLFTQNFPSIDQEFDLLILSLRVVPIARLCLKANPKLFANLLGYCVCIPERTTTDEEGNLIQMDPYNYNDDGFGLPSQVEENMIWWLDMFEGVPSEQIHKMFDRLYEIAWDVHYTYITILYRIFMNSKSKPYEMLEILIEESHDRHYFDLLYNYLLAAKTQNIGDEYKKIMNQKYPSLSGFTEYVFENEKTNIHDNETEENFFSTALYPATLPLRTTNSFPLPAGSNLKNDRRQSIHYPREVLEEKNEAIEATKIISFFNEKFDVKYSLSLSKNGFWNREDFLSRIPKEMTFASACNFFSVYVYAGKDLKGRILEELGKYRDLLSKALHECLKSIS